MYHENRKKITVLGITVLLLVTTTVMAEPVFELNDPALRPALAAQAEHQADLLRQPGVHAVGVGLMEDGTTVGIHVYADGGIVAHIAAQLDGVPVRVIESSGFVAHDGPCDAGACHAEVFALPVPMGVSVGNVNGNFAGTLGYRVRRKDNGEVGYVTNNHVAAASGANLCPAQLNPANVPAFGVDACQPGKLDNGNVCRAPKIGDLTQVVPLVMSGSFVNTVDAAYVKSNRGCVSKNIEDVGPPTSKKAKDPLLGEDLVLSGRSSGRRMVDVSAVNASVTVNYGAGCGNALFFGQAITEPLEGASASRPGDSGSPVVKKTATTVIAKGLNFAGDGFIGVINPMTAVLGAFNVEIDTAADAPPSASCP